jgi:esterase
MTTETGVQDKFVTLNGLRFHYRDWGDDHLPALVLLHGIMGHTRQWDRFAGEMVDRFRVLVLDQRGHGETAWADDYAQQRMDEDLHAFLEYLALRRVALVGQSMGGLNAYLYTARHPGVVERLVIGDFGPDVAHSTDGARVMGLVRARAAAVFDDPEEAVQAARAAQPRPSLDAVRHDTLANLVQRSDRRWVWRFDAARLSNLNDSQPAESDQWTLASHISCPTLLVRGGESETLSRLTAERMARTIPHCQLVELPSSGHGVPRDNPEAFTAAVRPFLLEQAG